MKVRIFILFILFVISGCSSSYHDHFFREHPDLQGSENISNGISTPGASHSSGQLESLPNHTTQDHLISQIHAAKKRIWIETYTWTDAAHLTDPIIRAHIRGVDVRVTLEGNVFGTPRINTPIIKKLKDAGIDVVYADNHRYTFTHAKFWIIDQTYSISTGNWTASFFTKNREYIYSDTDADTLRFLEEIFTVDAEHMPFRESDMIPSHIVLSPIDARAKIEGMISHTQDSLIVYVQTLDDEHILNLLSGLIGKGKRVEVCTADNESNQARQKQFPSWHWKMIKNPYLHAKVIIVDSKEVFVGSHNLTTNAIENNREMGIILHNRPDIVEQIQDDFVHDRCR